MKTFKPEFNEIKLTGNARTAIREYSTTLTDAILAQSKILAAVDQSDQVQAVHVVRAYDKILNAAAARKTWQHISGGVGTLLLGAASQGVFTEYFAADPKPSVFVTCFVFGLAGVFLWLISFFRR